MKLKEGYVLRKVADTFVVLPLNKPTIQFHGMLTLNNSGAQLWKVLEKGGSTDVLIQSLVTEYEVTWQQAKEDVEEFLDVLEKAGCIEK